MDFQSAMETFAEAWVAANAGAAQTQALALTRPKSPKKEISLSPHSPMNENRDQINRSTPPIQSSAPPSSQSLGGLQITNNTNQSTQSTPTTTTQPSITVSTSLMSTSQTQIQNINNGNSSEKLSISSEPSTPIDITSRSPKNNNNNSNYSNATLSPVNQHSNQSQQPTYNQQHLHSNSSSQHHHGIANFPSSKFNSNVSLLENGGMIGSNLGISDNGIDKILSASPTVDRKEFDLSKVNAKSLPLHCVVESFTSLQASLTNDSRSPWKRRSNIETDSYVIIPSATPFCDIVKTALQSLGYSIDIANTAKGTIIIKNWKPLSLEKITDSPLVSVGEILGELTSVITLRISVLRTKPSSLNEIKDKLLKLLILQSHAVLRSTGCPLDEIVLSQICRNNIPNSYQFEVSDDMRRKFEQWFNNQLSPQSNPITTKILPTFVNPNLTSASDLEFAARHIHNARESIDHTPHHNMIVHPALQTVHSQYPSQKTRMRTSFDPEMELPKLQKWFQENPHPSRQQIQSYVIHLNSLDSRRGRKPLDVNNVVYWFKNARAAQKRAELRGHGLANGYVNPAGMLMSHPDYMKSPHSIPSEDIDNLSQHSDDEIEEIDRVASPQVPLSLTTHERNRSPIKLEDVKIERDRSPTSSPIPCSNNNNNNNNNTSSNNLNNTNNIESEHLNHNNGSSSNNGNNLRQSDSPKTSPTSEELDMDDNEMISNDFRSPSPDSRRDLPFPIVPNSMFSHSIMYMSHYIPAAMGQGHHSTPNSSPSAIGPGGLNLSSLSNDERRKRNRTFIDPVTEVPKLEQWFAMNTHPSHNLILKYTEDLNRMPYRQKFPRLESKNVQFWFKNRRAKCKRLKMSLYDTSQLSGLGSFHPGDRD